MKHIHTEHNQSDTEFIVLNNKLSVKDIIKYLDEINNIYEFKTADREYIEPDVLNQFIDWLIDENKWAGCKREYIERGIRHDW